MRQARGLAGGCKFGVLSGSKKTDTRHRAELSSAVADSIPVIPAGKTPCLFPIVFL